MATQTKGKRQKKPKSNGEVAKEIRDAILNDIRQAAGQPAKGKGAGKRNRQHKAGGGGGMMQNGRKIERKFFKFSEQLVNYIPGYTGIGTQVITVNPGDPLVFPRLSQMCKLFVFWRFKKLRITWVPNGSAFAGANQTGEVVVAYTNGWYDTPPTTVPVARSRSPNMVCEAWIEKSMNVPAEELAKDRFIRDNPSASAADARLYDSLIVCTVAGTPNTSNIGYLTIDGELEVWEDYTPITTGNLAPLQNRHSFWYNTNDQVVTTATITPFAGPGTVQCITSYLCGPVVTVSGVVLWAVPAGTYKMTIEVYVMTTTSLASIEVTPNVASALQSTAGTNAKNTVAGTTYSYSRTDSFVVAEGQTATIGPTVTIVGVGTITMKSWKVMIDTLG